MHASLRSSYMQSRKGALLGSQAPRPSTTADRQTPSASESVASSISSLDSAHTGNRDEMMSASMHAMSTAFMEEQEQEDTSDHSHALPQDDIPDMDTETFDSPSASQVLRQSNAHREQLSVKIRELFGLPATEEVKRCHPCWLFRTILLRGYAYITTSYLCFYAYLPSKNGSTTRAGPLLKRTRRTMRFSKHWAVLRDNALSWYESEKDPYFPQGHIDLRTVSDVSAVPVAGKEAQFTVETPDRTFLFCAPSDNSRSEWISAVQKAVFRANNDGDSVRISIPFEAILDVEESDSRAVDPALATLPLFAARDHDHSLPSSAPNDLVAIKVVERDSDFALDEFHFLNFGRRRERFLSDLRAVVGKVAGRDISSSDSAAEDDTALSTTPSARQGAGLSYPPSRGTSSGVDQGSTGILRNVPAWVSRSSGEAGRLLRQAPSAGSRLGAMVMGTLDEAERRARQVTEIWTAPSVEEVHVAEGDRSESSNIAPDDEAAASTPSKDDSEKLFRWTFPMARDEKLLATAASSLYRVLPAKGMLFISERHLCFRSSGLTTRTVGRTLMMLPVADIISVGRHRAFQPGHHGLVVVIRGHEEIFLEFPSEAERDTVSKIVEDQLEALMLGEEREVSRAKGDDLILRDLTEKLDADVASPGQTTSQSFGERGSVASTDNDEAFSRSASSSAFLSFKPTQPMHFTMLTVGSRGDVQPYIALAKGLMKDGHTTRIATHGEFRGWVEGHGIEFASVGGDPAELIRICVENGTFTLSFVKESMLKFRGWLDDLLISSWEACQGTDVIIESPSAIAGIHVAERLQVPYFRAFTMPWTRTRAYPHAFAVPGSKAGGNYNYIVSVDFQLLVAPSLIISLPSSLTSSSITCSGAPLQDRSIAGARIASSSSPQTMSFWSSTRYRSSTTSARILSLSLW